MNTAVSSALSPALDAQAAPATPTPIPTALPASSLAPAPAAPRRGFALPARLQSPVSYTHLTLPTTPYV